MKLFKLLERELNVFGGSACSKVFIKPLCHLSRPSRTLSVYIRIVTVFHHIAQVQSIYVKYSLIYFGESLYSGASGSGYREQPLHTHDTD